MSPSSGTAPAYGRGIVSQLSLVVSPVVVVVVSPVVPVVPVVSVVSLVVLFVSLVGSAVVPVEVVLVVPLSLAPLVVLPVGVSPVTTGPLVVDSLSELWPVEASLVLPSLLLDLPPHPASATPKARPSSPVVGAWLARREAPQKGHARAS